MKKLDVRFDTEKVNKELEGVPCWSHYTNSQVIRAALNLGLSMMAKKESDQNDELIEKFK